MPILSDPRHERFAQLMAEKRMSNAEAYRQAAGKLKASPHSDAVTANKWLNRTDIASRIKELQAQTSERCSLTRERYVQSLAQMYEAKPEDASMSNPLCDVLITRGQKHAVFPQKMAIAAQISKVLGWEKPTEVKVEAGETLAGFLGKIFGAGVSKTLSDENHGDATGGH
jgi:hypothetical protein